MIAAFFKTDMKTPSPAVSALVAVPVRPRQCIETQNLAQARCRRRTLGRTGFATQQPVAVSRAGSECFLGFGVDGLEKPYRVDDELDAEHHGRNPEHEQAIPGERAGFEERQDDRWCEHHL